MQNSTFSLKAVLSYAFATSVKEWKKIIGISLIWGLICAVVYLLIFGSFLSIKQNSFLALLIPIALGAAVFPIYLGTIHYFLDLHDNPANTSYRTLFSYYNRDVLPYFKINIFVALATILAGICLIIPGIYVHYMLSFVFLIAAEYSVSTREAFRYSARLTKNVKLKLFLLEIICGIIQTIVTFTIIGYFVVGAFNLLAMIHAYRTLQSNNH
jgi:hypothetical protein